MLTIRFGEPCHGWLPVVIKYGDITEEFLSSNIPVDSVTALWDIINSAISGVGGEVWWHLEPSGYYLSITKEKDMYFVDLKFSEKSRTDDRDDVFNFVGSFEEVILPIWRAIKEFYSHKYDGWDCVPPERLRSLDDQIKKLKAKK